MSSPFTGTSSFGGALAPPDVTAKILSLLIDNAPFAASLTRLPTQRGSVSFPVASPGGWGWTAEGAKLPQINLNDDVVEVAACKIGGVLRVSNELVHDSVINLTTAIGQLLKDGLSVDVDQGLLYGTGSANHQPTGIVTTAPEVTGPDLLTGVAAAVGALGDAGGTATRTAMSGSAWSTEAVRVDSNGSLVYPAGQIATIAGTTPVIVPGMADVLTYDPSRLYLVVSQDSTVTFSDDFYFDLDSQAVRIVARISIASPTPDKAARKVVVAAGP
jgi:HK97 family phage major capsid protein